MERALNSAVALGFAIKLLRGVRRWNQSELANESGITQAHVSKIENGNASPSNEILRELAKALGVKTATIWETAEQILDTGCSSNDSKDYLACLTTTGVDSDDVNNLVAEIDLQTVAMCEQLSSRISSGTFTICDFDKFASLVDRLTADESPGVKLVAQLSKEVGDLCQNLASVQGSNKRSSHG